MRAVQGKWKLIREEVLPEELLGDGERERERCLRLGRVC